MSDEELACTFAEHRPYLHAMAYRMLGSHADADDVVQEAWIRFPRVGGGIAELRGWLTIVTSRICLDLLRARGVRREQPLEISLSMPPGSQAGNPSSDPEQEEGVGVVGAGDVVRLASLPICSSSTSPHWS